MPTPEHHHYAGMDCGHRGSTCTADDCQWAIDAGLLPLHDQCEEDHTFSFDKIATPDS